MLGYSRYSRHNYYVVLFLTLFFKYPIANPKDGDNAAKTPFFGIQEGPTDGLLLSGVFVEDAKTGVSAGYQQVLKRTT